MTAGMNQVRKRFGSYGFRSGPLCAVAVIAASMVGVIGAPAAVAADAQSKQWYLDAMRVDEIWKTSTGEGVKIAVIDSGVNASTPSLKGQVLKGLDATETDGTTNDYDGHGTTIAELIAGTGEGGGLKGLAPGAKIIPMRVAFKEFEEKHKTKTTFDSANAIRAAADSDAKIINFSGGSVFMHAAEKEAVEYAHSKGKLFFAAVGNTGDEANKPGYPANYPEVVGVAATDREGQVAKYSQHGEVVDIAAPANDIPGWCDETFTKYCDGNGGTSAASALASATAALIWSANPDWTANQVLRVMFESAGRGDDWKPGTVSNYLGHGIVRPNAAINRGIGKPGDPDVSPLTNERTTAGGSADVGAPSEEGAKDDGADSSPPKSGAEDDGKDKGKDTDTVAAGSAEDSGDDSQLGLILGGVAVVAVLAGGAFAVVRKRRTA
ncbi:S8 family serine peptidase [Streptomyces niveus]|uniref:S8 family serine peptidase n=1 Tax=Streptomyces niveus TaxID=193462 RepID=A0ABZ1ZZX5_STRNV|nr:S8 family serine peptidase [Streptomyces niveus]